MKTAALPCLAIGLCAFLLPFAAIGQEAAPQPTAADVRYGRYDRNVVDFFRAETTKPAPALIYFHGGGWLGGEEKLDEAGVENVLQTKNDGSDPQAMWKFLAKHLKPEGAPLPGQ